MKKDTRFSIRKLTVGVASIAVASFLTSGTVDAADLSIFHSKSEKAAGYNPELPFEPFPPSISYTQPEAPWMQGSVDTEVPGDDVEEVTEPNDANYVNPEAPFAPVEEEEEVTEPRKPNYEDPEAPFAPVEEEEEVTEPRKPNYENPEAPFAPVEEEEEVTEPRKPNYEDPEAPFAPVEEEEEVTEPRKPNYEDPEAPFAPVEEEEETTEPRKPNYKDPEDPFAPVEEEETPEEETPETEEDELEVLPGYKVEEVEGADGKTYKRLVPIEEEVEEGTSEVEESEFEVLPGYKVEEVVGADGKTYKRLVPVEETEPEEEEEDLPALEVKVVQETETIPYETERRANADMYVGDEEIVQPGQEGKVVKEFEVTYAGDEEISRKEVRVVESVEPVTEIVDYGTKPVQDTKVETRRVEKVLPIVEKEDPELPEGETRNVPGTPKVTEITEEIMYERGKVLSRKTIKEEVIDEGTAEIKYVGTKRVETITETETIPYETERRANADMYVGDEEIVQPGQEGKVVKEFEVTYAGDEEISRKEVRVVESVEPVTEIVDYGTKPVQDTKVETRRVEKVLPIVEKEDPELPEGETRNVPGTPKVTEITEEIMYERGKVLSRKTIKEEVIDEGTAEIKYIGTKRVETITDTETLTHETERRENADLYEGTERVVQEGKDGSVTKEYEVTYIKGEEKSRQVVRVVESVDPVKEIIEFGTKKDQPVKWTVDYGIAEPSEEAQTNAKETSSLIKAEINQISALFEQGLQFMIWNSKAQSTKDFYQKYLDASQADDGQTVIADFLDYYRKSKNDRKETLTLEDLVKDSKGKTGSIYETMVLAAAEKLGVTTIKPGQSMNDYKTLMGNYMLGNRDGENIYKDVMNNGDFGAYAPRQGAIDSVNEDFDNIKSLLDHWQDSFKTITNDDTITREETLARILEYYRQVSGQSKATLREAIEDLANYSFSQEGMKAMVNHYDPTLEPLSDIEAYQKVMAITKQGELMESELNFFNDTVLEILNNLGLTAN